jgi:hypothetical protein
LIDWEARVTELTEPLAAAPTETTADVPAQTIESHALSFSELVRTRFDWRREQRRDGARSRAKTAYDAAVADFEHRHGEIASAYWCSNVESGVALTHQKRSLPWATPGCTFHRESDWATQNSPDIACELHRCDELAVRAKTVLTGVRQRICMQLVMASAAHLLGLVDARAAHANDAETSAALQQERAALAKAEAYYREAANGQAQMIYFSGMAAVAGAISIVAAVWLTIDWASPVGALIAGAVGAVVSVIQRINNGKFTLDFDVGRPYAFFLGGLRPLIGGAFAMAIAFAFSGGLLHLPVAANEPTNDRRLALLVFSFFAGFSERWAQDTLTAVLPTAHQQPATETAPAATAAQTDGRAP